MANLPVPNFGAIIGASRPNPFTQISQAIGQFPEQRAEAQARKMQLEQLQQQGYINDQTIEDNRIKTQANAFGLEQQQRAAAQQGYDFLKNQVLANPNLFRNPAAVEQLKKYDATLGTNSFHPDGQVNVDSFKTPFSSLPLEQQQAFWALPLDQRAAAAKNLAGLPPDWETRPPELDQKTAAQVAEFQSHANLYQQQTLSDAIKSYNDSRATTSKLAVDKSTIARNTAENAYRAAEAQAALSRASTEAYRANQEAAVNAYRIAEIKQKLMSGNVSPQDRQFFVSQIKTFQTSITKGEDAVAGATDQLTKLALSHNIDPAKDPNWMNALLKRSSSNSTEYGKVLDAIRNSASAQQQLTAARQDLNTTIDYVRAADPVMGQYLGRLGQQAPEIVTTDSKGPKPLPPTNDPRWTASIARGYKPLYKEGKGWGVVSPKTGVWHAYEPPATSFAGAPNPPAPPSDTKQLRGLGINSVDNR